MWEEGSQTLTLGFGTTIFCIEVDHYSFLMALTVATDMPDTLNLDVQLNRAVKYSGNWFELDKALFQKSAAHMDTYYGQLSPRHQLDVSLRKGTESGEGCWFVDINVNLCGPEVPDNSQSHSNRPDNNRPDNSQPDNNRPSKTQPFMSIFKRDRESGERKRAMQALKQDRDKKDRERYQYQARS